MNDNVVARPCWTILAQKAEDKIALIKNELMLARQRLMQQNAPSAPGAVPV